MFFQEEIIVKARAPLKRQDIAKRPSAEEAMIKLPVTIGASLKQVLDKRMNELSLQESANAGTLLPYPLNMPNFQTYLSFPYE